MSLCSTVSYQWLIAKLLLLLTKLSTFIDCECFGVCKSVSLGKNIIILLIIIIQNHIHVVNQCKISGKKIQALGLVNTYKTFFKLICK